MGFDSQMQAAFFAEVTSLTPFPNERVIAGVRCTAAKTAPPARAVASIVACPVMAYYFVSNVKADKFKGEP
jgi:hypothetical protein